MTIQSTPTGSTALNRPDDQSDESAAFSRDGVKGLFLKAVTGRRVALAIRVSSLKQLVNTGSIEAQRMQARFAQSYGVPLDRIDTFDLLGESGREDVARPRFDALVAAIESGAYGLVVTYSVDRIGRNDIDNARLMSAMRTNNTILLSGGIVCDPRDPNEALTWKILAAIAVHDNALRQIRSVLTKAVKASNHRLAVTLPAGLGWYDPTDAAYMLALDDAKLGGWMDGETLASWVHSDRLGMKRYPLPMPDADIVTACELRMQYLREEGSIDGVLRRICDPNNRDWPSAFQGRVPVLNATRRKRHQSPLDRPFVGSRFVEWVPADAKKLEKFFRRPANYGIYSVNMESLLGMKTETIQQLGLQSRIWVEGAFKGFAPSIEYHENTALLDRAPARRTKSSTPHARVHALPLVECGELVNGHICGYRLSPVYGLDTRGNVYQASKECRHGLVVSAKIEEPVLELIAACLDPNRLAEALAGIEVRRRSFAADIAKHEESIAKRHDFLREIERLIITAGVEARSKGEPPEASKSVISWTNRRSEALAEQQRDEVLVHQKRREAANSEGLQNAELQQVLRLASDLPAHLRELLAFDRSLVTQIATTTDGVARAVLAEQAGKVRAVLESLVEVVRIRRLADATYEATVVFRTGDTASVVVATRGVRANQAERTWLAWRRHAVPGHDALARELNECEAITTSVVATTWSAKDVANALVYADLFDESPKSLRFQRVSELAGSLNEREAEILRAILSGELGTAGVSDGEFAVEVDEVALQKMFPAHARRWVAARHGWTEMETRLVTELAQMHSVTPTTVVNWAESGDGVTKDLAGRRYTTLRSVDEIDDRRLERLLQDAALEVQTLERNHWRRVEGLGPSIPTDRLTLDRYCVRVPAQPGSDRARVWYWLDPAAVERIKYRGLSRAVAHGSGGALQDMVPLDQVIDALKKEGLALSHDEIVARLKTKDVEVVTVGGSPGTIFVRVPLAAWGASHARVLLDWFST